MKLLLAEDELDLAEALTVFFEKNHFTVDAVHNGFDAYEYAVTGGYDGIVLDVMMPKLNGIQVLEKLRSEGVSTPIMMLTAKGQTEDRITGFNAGADDYLPKPFDPVVRSVQRQKQFITDASHELKTPITVIATSLKVLEMEVGKQKWIDKALGQTEKLTSLVSSLVTLSRMDEEDSPLKPEPFPISEAVEETAESFRDLAQSKGHELSLSIAPGLIYTGDEYALRQLVSILLDNAIKYALPGAPISLTLAKGRRGVVLTAANRCDPAPELDPGKLFDRFYRADPARSSTGGFGIGLSIARSIAEGHHGSISAKLEGDTITFTAILK